MASLSSSTTHLLKTLTLSAYPHRLCLPISAAKPPFLSLPLLPRPLPATLRFAAETRPSRSVVPLVARTSDWAPEDVVDEGDGGSWNAGDSDGVFEERDDEGEASYAPPPEEAKIYVGNMPFDVDSQRLAMLFEQAGVVEMAEVIYNRETDRSRGFGFVTMSSVEEADKAIELFNRYDLDGRMLTVNKASSKGERVERPPRAFEPSFRIYVGNLPWDTDNGRLEQIFSGHGKVVEARVFYDRETGRSRGFGFVTMASEAEMEGAIAALDGQSMDGRAIRVNVALERPRRSF